MNVAFQFEHLRLVLCCAGCVLWLRGLQSNWGGLEISFLKGVSMFGLILSLILNVPPATHLSCEREYLAKVKTCAPLPIYGSVSNKEYVRLVHERSPCYAAFSEQHRFCVLALEKEK